MDEDLPSSSNPPSSTLKRSFSQLALDNNMDDLRPSSSSSSASDSQTRQESPRPGASTTSSQSRHRCKSLSRRSVGSVASPRPSLDNDSEDSQGRYKRARSTSFDGSVADNSGDTDPSPSWIDPVLLEGLPRSHTDSGGQGSSTQRADMVGRDTEVIVISDSEEGSGANDLHAPGTSSIATAAVSDSTVSRTPTLLSFLEHGIPPAGMSRASPPEIRGSQPPGDHDATGVISPPDPQQASSEREDVLHSPSWGSLGLRGGEAVLHEGLQLHWPRAEAIAMSPVRSNSPIDISAPPGVNISNPRRGIADDIYSSSADSSLEAERISDSAEPAIDQEASGSGLSLSIGPDGYRLSTIPGRMGRNNEVDSPFAPSSVPRTGGRADTQGTSRTPLPRIVHNRYSNISGSTDPPGFAASRLPIGREPPPVRASQPFLHAARIERQRVRDAVSNRSIRLPPAERAAVHTSSDVAGDSTRNAPRDARRGSGVGTRASDLASFDQDRLRSLRERLELATSLSETSSDAATNLDQFRDIMARVGDVRQTTERLNRTIHEIREAMAEMGDITEDPSATLDHIMESEPRPGSVASRSSGHPPDNGGPGLNRHSEGSANTLPSTSTPPGPRSRVRFDLGLEDHPPSPAEFNRSPYTRAPYGAAYTSQLQAVNTANGSGERRPPSWLLAAGQAELTRARSEPQRPSSSRPPSQASVHVASRHQSPSQVTPNAPPPRVVPLPPTPPPHQTLPPLPSSRLRARYDPRQQSSRTGYRNSLPSEPSITDMHIVTAMSHLGPMRDALEDAVTTGSPSPEVVEAALRLIEASHAFDQVVTRERRAAAELEETQWTRARRHREALERTLSYYQERDTDLLREDNPSLFFPQRDPLRRNQSVDDRVLPGNNRPSVPPSDTTSVQGTYSYVVASRQPGSNDWPTRPQFTSLEDRISHPISSASASAGPGAASSFPIDDDMEVEALLDTLEAPARSSPFSRAYVDHLHSQLGATSSASDGATRTEPSSSRPVPGSTRNSVNPNINLSAYHNGPMRSALARSLTLDRRRRQLEEERQRISEVWEQGLQRSSSARHSTTATAGSASSDSTSQASRSTRLETPVEASHNASYSAYMRRLAEDYGDPRAAADGWLARLRRPPSRNDATTNPRPEVLHTYVSRIAQQHQLHEPPTLLDGRHYDVFFDLPHFSSSRGVPESVINGFPNGTYSEWATAGESEERCPICFEDYESTDPLLRLPDCSHWFHKPCLLQWLRTSNTCPMCRARVGGSDPAPREIWRPRGSRMWLRGGNAHLTTADHPGAPRPAPPVPLHRRAAQPTNPSTQSTSRPAWARTVHIDLGTMPSAGRSRTPERSSAPATPTLANVPDSLAAEHPHVRSSTPPPSQDTSAPSSTRLHQRPVSPSLRSPGTPPSFIWYDAIPARRPRRDPGRHGQGLAQSQTEPRNRTNGEEGERRNEREREGEDSGDRDREPSLD